MPLVISFVARKGGVGKTSTALNLAGAALSDGIARVTVVDLDSQASLTKALYPDHESLRLNDSVQAATDTPAESLLRETAIEGLTILPAHPDLRLPSGSQLQLATLPSDLVLIDTPPDTANPAVRAALMASDAVISPVVPEAWGLQSIPGVSQLLMSAATNQNLTFAGWLPSMVQPRLAIHSVCLDTLQRLHGQSVYAAHLPHATAFKVSAAEGKPITLSSPRSAAAKAVKAVWTETLDRLESAQQRRVA
jgi:chromosome partitioning protein